MIEAPVLEYHGLSSFSIEFEGTTVVVDPWIDDPDWSYLELEDFSATDYILVTHGAYDHVSDAQPIAEESGSTVVTEPAVADSLIASGLPDDQVRTVIWGNTFKEAGIEFRVLETRHLSYFTKNGERYSGLPLGFYMDFGSVSLYYLGDTSIFSNLRLFDDLYNPDIAMIPVGHAPGDLAPLPPEDAATVATWLDVKEIIPVHYVPGDPAPLKFQEHLAEAAGNVDDNVQNLNVGDRLHLGPFE